MAAFPSAFGTQRTPGAPASSRHWVWGDASTVVQTDAREGMAAFPMVIVRNARFTGPAPRQTCPPCPLCA